jgi:2-polyprenyl-3-methyl-5-hydroxy-6-metoxy-1,4-benzoquinol methylase/uncharacterized protein YbaR (Trm112 family)
MSTLQENLLKMVRCPVCHASLTWAQANIDGTDASLVCIGCNERFPVIGGIPRLLLAPMREALLMHGRKDAKESKQIETALSFGYEWSNFSEMYEEWETSFLAYMQPHPAEFFRGKRVLDAGCGNGRFAYYAAKYGADVWAIDLSSAVEVAHRNTTGAGSVQVIQADLHQPPFAPESFDFIYSLGVLHHLPDPEAAFRNLLRFVRPGGEVQIYLYWKPEKQPIKSALLAAITAVRQVTTRLPHSAVHVLALPAAVAAHVFLVWPYKLLKRVSGFAGLAERLPMKQYAAFPFRVCVNDQFDRFSAPIENRYTRREVNEWLTRAGLEETKVAASYGWVGTGRKPAASAGVPGRLK